MKNSVAAILVSAAIVTSALISSCGAPQAQPAAIDGPNNAPDQGTTSYLVLPATAGERLEGMQRANQMLINQYLMTGTPVPDSLYEQTQLFEKAKNDLLNLDGQRAGLQMLGAQHVANAEPIPDSEYELARSIEESRRRILESVGLTD